MHLGTSTIAIVPRDSEARLEPLCEELKPDERKLDRQRRANNPQNYDEKGRVRKHAKRRLVREIIHIGNEIRIEKISYKGWQKQFAKSVGFRAPGMLIDRLRRTVASTPVPALRAAYLKLADITPSSAQYHLYWESAEPRLQAALEQLIQPAKEGQVLPRSVGITGVGARLPKSLETSQQELVYRRGRLEALE